MKPATRFSVLFAALFGVYSHLSACISPTNVEGVAFTGNEVLHLDSLSALGYAGVDYKVSLNENGGTTVTFQSHYNPGAMVFIGETGLLYKPQVKLNCMGIIIPPYDDTLNSHSPVPLETFNFQKAVKTELEWLAEYGILDITSGMIDSIGKKLGEQDNGGVQYWTKQHSTLHYNSWYVYNTVNEEWDMNQTDGVNGITSGVNGCSVINIPAFVNFEKTPVKQALLSPSGTKDLLIDVSGKSVFVDGSISSTSGRISVVSASGRTIRVCDKIQAGKAVLTLNDIAPGTYVISCKISGRTLNRSIFIQ